MNRVHLLRSSEVVKNAETLVPCDPPAPSSSVPLQDPGPDDDEATQSETDSDEEADYVLSVKDVAPEKEPSDEENLDRPEQPVVTGEPSEPALRRSTRARAGTHGNLYNLPRSVVNEVSIETAPSRSSTEDRQILLELAKAQANLTQLLMKNHLNG